MHPHVPPAARFWQLADRDSRFIARPLSDGQCHLVRYRLPLGEHLDHTHTGPVQILMPRIMRFGMGSFITARIANRPPDPA